MLPCLAVHNLRHSRCADTVFFAQRLLLFTIGMTTTNSSNVFLGQLGLYMTTTMPFKSMTYCMVFVFGTRDPFEIPNTVVKRVTIYMINLPIINTFADLTKWRTEKSLGNEMVNVVCRTGAVFVETDDPAPGACTPDEDAVCAQRADAPGVAYEIAIFETPDRFPNLRGVRGVRGSSHDSKVSLLLWLGPEVVFQHRSGLSYVVRKLAREVAS